MAFDSHQARQLFLAEALELCQQVKEGLLLLAHDPMPLSHQKLVRRVQTLRQGALHLGLTDIQLLADGLGSVLEVWGDPSPESSAIHELLQHLCDGLQLSLITHSSVTDANSAPSQRDFVLHSLVPKGLEVFEIVSAQTFPEALQANLLLQQVQWMQFWSQSLDLAELKRIAEVTLTTFEAFPSAIPAIAQVAFAGFQVAHESILQFDAVSDLSLIAPADLGSSPQPSLWPSERALEILNTEKHLVGLVRQTIFCIATDSIEEIVLYETHQLQNNNGHEYILWRDRSLLLHQLTDLWPPSSPSVLLSTAPKSSAMILILTHEAQPLALALDVDRLIVEPALKLNRPDNTFTPQRCCYGLTTLGQDSGMAVVDVNCLLQEQLSVALLSGLSSLENHDPRRFQASLALSPKAFRPPQPNLTPAELKTILIVDDSKTVRAMLALTLQEAGYNVLQAQDGQQAIEYLQGQANIHLTICDLEMSNLNGFEFLRHRLQNQHWIQIPVLILSSHTGEEYRQLSKKLGAVDYFTIPYDRAALLQTIERLLNPNHL